MLDVASLSRHNGQFIRQRGRLRVFSAGDATIAVRCGDRAYQICHIGFSLDGSIRVQWPYLPVRQGIVAAVSIPDSGGSVEIKLTEVGRFTSQLVKFSHHTSGATHFNKTMYTNNEVRRQTFRLDTTIGRIFELSAYYLEAFKPLQRLKPGRLYLVFDLGNRLPRAVQIKGDWTRKQSIVTNSDRKRTTIGPSTSWTHRYTGLEEAVAFYAPPLKCVIKEYLLGITCQPILPPAGVIDAGVVFLGAFDAHERPEATVPERVPMGGCLIALYPTSAHESTVSRVGTIDLNLPPR
jgi:hypothetical protein